METTDGMNAEMARLFGAKLERRKALSRLPFPEKVRAVVGMQKMSAPILHARGIAVRPWQMDGPEDGAGPQAKNECSD